jgi:hypothetical protein
LQDLTVAHEQHNVDCRIKHVPYRRHLQCAPDFRILDQRGDAVEGRDRAVGMRGCAAAAMIGVERIRVNAVDNLSRKNR